MPPSPPPAAILVAPDKFKGTLSSEEAGAAIAAGLRRAWPDAAIRVLPLADGGEGFVRALVLATDGRFHSSETVDARGRACRATWGELGDGRTAAFELASAAGLSALAPEWRDPLETSTWGCGLVLRDILHRGFNRILIGLGGSATNDGGLGLAAALGYSFQDARGQPVPLTGAGLARVARIVAPPSPPKLELIAATDVDNPLYGPEGAACQFARQKGADDAAIARLDAGLRQFAAVVAAHAGRDLAGAPGAGAAGGAAFGLMALLGAQRRSGFDVLREAAGLDALVRRSALVVTGEGCLDRTSFAGKAPVRLAELARSHGVPVWGVFGRIDPSVRSTPAFVHVAATTPVVDDPAALPVALHAARLADAAYSIASYTSGTRA